MNLISVKVYPADWTPCIDEDNKYYESSKLVFVKAKRRDGTYKFTMGAFVRRAGNDIVNEWRFTSPGKLEMVEWYEFPETGRNEEEK